MWNYKYIFSFIFILIGFHSNAETYVDSLKSALKNQKLTPKERTLTYGNIAWEYLHIDLDSAIFYANLELKHAEKNKLKHQIGDALNTIGSVYRLKGDYRLALENFQQSIKLYLSISDTLSLAAMYNNVGIIYQYLENPKKALSYHEKGLDYYSKSNDLEGIANTYGNMGICYDNMKDFKNAEKSHLQSLKIKKELKDTSGMVNSYVNLGGLYYKAKNYLNAEQSYEKAMQFSDPENDQLTYASILADLGTIQIYKNKFNEGIVLCKKAFDIAENKKWIELLKSSCHCLYLGYKSTDKKDLALTYFEKFMIYKDSTNNQELNSDIAMKEAEFDYSLKYTEDSLNMANQKKITDAENKAALEKKQFQQYVLYGGLILVLVFAVFMYNRYRISQKQKNVIEEKEKETQIQKQIIEEKQKEIIDSINYAQRLQQAILTPESELKKYFPNSFLHYKPKDIVAGDFYFFEVTGKHIFYAAADCTGHGVPGAMMSIVCSNALSRCVKEFGLTDPGKILDKTRELVLETFEKSETDVKDGMDISLVTLAYRERAENKSGIEITGISWSGANNPIWYIENRELKEITADKQPIGKSHEPKPFTTYSLPLSLSTLFLFTDGYADQFGGPKGKKFKYSNLKKLLLEKSNENSDKMNTILHSVFTNWKGELEQVDDVCIIGIRI